MRSFWVKFAFLLALLWWVYLFFTTKFVIVYDAEGYEQLGRIIAYHGWADFLHNGVQREPLFLWLVALSMRLGDWWVCSYEYPLKIIGIGNLFLTLLFSYRLMRMLSVRPFIAALALLYMGISPVMTNSSMRLWSEFATYPWVVLAVIWTIKSWRFLDNISQERKDYFRISKYAMMVALMFLLIMFVKAVAECILIVYLWPFYWRIFSECQLRNFVKARQVAVFCLVVLIIFESVVCGYKWCNYHYNGNFAFTNRGILLVYGSTKRRTEPLTLESLGAALAYVPGMGICTSMFSQADCRFWSGQNADAIWGQKSTDLANQGFTGNAAANHLVFDCVKLILSDPLQIFALMGVEAQKMFFWESSLDFVTYPDWLDRFLHCAGFSYSLRIILAVLSWVSLIFAFFVLCRRSQELYFNDKKQKQALFWIVNFVFWYIWMFSWVHILDRFSFPLISLFIVLISFLADRVFLLLALGSGSLSQYSYESEVNFRSNQNRNIFIFLKQNLVWAIIFLMFIIYLGWFLIAPYNSKVIWERNPLVAFITKEHIQVEQKSKLVTLSYWTPDFVYFSKIVSGDLQPKIVMAAGYPAYYRKAVELFPDNDAIHYLSGFCEYYQGNLDTALEQYEISAELNPDFFWTYYNLGVIYFKQGEFLKSALILNKALSLRKEITLIDLNKNPFYWQTWHFLENPGDILESNLSEGIKDAVVLLVACVIMDGKYDQAVQIIRSVGQVNPWHQGLARELLKRALNRNSLTQEIISRIEEQVQVRLF